MSAPALEAVPLVPNQNSGLPADPGSAVITATKSSDNLAADIALAMSAAPFIGSSTNDNDGSDYGTDGTSSKTPSVHNIQNTGTDIGNESGGEDSFHTDSNDVVAIYDGIHSDLFEDLFQTLPTNAQYRAPDHNPNGCFGPLLLSDQDHQTSSLDQPAAFSALHAHADDGLFLSSLYHKLTFEQRADLLYVHWDTLHAYKSLLEIKHWLESLSQSDHLLLIHLHAAYWITTLVVTTTFGATKSHFWIATNIAGHFVNGIFVVQRDVPLTSVTVESLLVRTVGQWVQYLTAPWGQHELTAFQIWDVSEDDVVDFAQLDSTVHPKSEVLLPALISFVNYCSDAYRTAPNIEFMLQRQASSCGSAPLNLTTMDANILLSTYFPGQYDVDNLQAPDGLFLLRRAHSFVLASPTYLQWSSECNHRWTHLLACV